MIKIGTMAEVATSKGLCYIQLINSNRLMGQLVRAVDGSWPERPVDIAEVAAGPTAFICFFPFGTAVRQKLIHVVGDAPIPPADSEFPIFRSGTANPKTKKVESWWLWDGERSWNIGPISDAQKKFPIRGIWNFELLRGRLESDWRPELDAR